MGVSAARNAWSEGLTLLPPRPHTGYMKTNRPAKAQAFHESEEPFPAAAKKHLEFAVTFEDGRSNVERYERNDAVGRNILAKAAATRVSDPGVTLVRVSPVSSITGRGRKGSYR